MTLSIAWLRHVEKTEELVIITDSRLRSGLSWDCCPKLFPMPRGDCAIAFAGDTLYSYPIIQQAANAVQMYPKSRSRAMDIGSLRGHVIRLMNGMMEYISDIPKDTPEVGEVKVSFIFAGYSWREAKFKIWTISFDNKKHKFTYATPSTLHRKRIAFAGDYIGEVKRRILKLLKERSKNFEDGFDMEPFEVLRDMIREDDGRRYPYIGGPPQIIKIYKHMNYMPYSVYWPDKQSKKISLLGRPLLDYETYPFLKLDPDTLEVIYPATEA